jgi:hypothetical protein
MKWYLNKSFYCFPLYKCKLFLKQMKPWTTESLHEKIQYILYNCYKNNLIVMHKFSISLSTCQIINNTHDLYKIQHKWTAFIFYWEESLKNVVLSEKRYSVTLPLMSTYVDTLNSHYWGISLYYLSCHYLSILVNFK